MSVPAIAADRVVETFPAFGTLGSVRHGFIGRIPGLDVASDRAEALQRLEAIHGSVRGELGLDGMRFATAGQVHGNEIAVLNHPLGEDFCAEGVDGLITDQPDILLGIYVADCCAVFLVDPTSRSIGLVHSGRKGTELGIATKAVEAMRENFGARPGDLVVQLSPCIRPPHYEVDFAAEIVRRLRAAGVKKVHDSGRCTACDLSRYYSYRAEKARTGRMLALLALADDGSSAQQGFR